MELDFDYITPEAKAKWDEWVREGDEGITDFGEVVDLSISTKKGIRPLYKLSIFFPMGLNPILISKNLDTGRVDDLRHYPVKEVMDRFFKYRNIRICTTEEAEDMQKIANLRKTYEKLGEQLSELGRKKDE